MLLVLKVSGHLYKYPFKIVELMSVLEFLTSNGIGIAVVPGGSIFADSVRELQRVTGFNDDVAHWMAIKAMEVYGLLLKGFSKNFVEAYSLEDITEALNNKLIPIIMPYKLLRTYNELPHSWDITSDSISVYVAHLLNANLVALGKIVEGIVGFNGEIIKSTKIDVVLKFVEDELDPYTLKLAKEFKIPIAVFNILKPQLLNKITKLELDNYTLILP
ncbi:MAG: hypothetical protein QW775_07490 [Ignisphaera sp.]|uniref:Aspartate/glutamate/uridylate kinase domain-containing protein n=1 Tax=Ignisphaera aggregans TaxID=334771 RepID=A0A7C4NM05_9CREN